VLPYLPVRIRGDVRPRPSSVAAPRLLVAAAVLDRWLGGSASVRQRLARLGTDLTVEQFRVEQLVWGLAASGVAAVLLGLRTASGAVPGPVVALCFLTIAGVAGVLARDRWLSRAVERRHVRLCAELPTIAELLALSVAAGEGTSAAIERVSRVAHGELSAEFSVAVAQMRTGLGMVEALQSLASRVDVPDVTRIVEAIVVAIERGTPLAHVLQAQAAEAREAQRRRLIEIGGRKDILMMVPVVFLVLPLSVVFALFPGFYGLSLSAP